jgi:hypothetical protein
VLVQVADGAGWRTVDRLHPRNRASEEWAQVGGGEGVRLLAESAVLVRSVSRLTRAAGTAVVQSVPPVGASLAAPGDAMAGVAAADGATAAVSGDTLDLAFMPPPRAEGLVREQFLMLRGTREVAPGAAALGRVADDAAIPAHFALHQNQPNPFAGTTTFRFDLPAPARVTLEVFDAQGRRVAALADGPWAAGAHAVEWGRRDRRGRIVRPGVYVYRLEAGAFRAERKLVVLP